jgi:hypothetical protein
VKTNKIVENRFSSPNACLDKYPESKKIRRKLSPLLIVANKVKIKLFLTKLLSTTIAKIFSFIVLNILPLLIQYTPPENKT